MWVPHAHFMCNPKADTMGTTQIGDGHNSPVDFGCWEKKAILSFRMKKLLFWGGIFLIWDMHGLKVCGSLVMTFWCTMSRRMEIIHSPWLRAHNSSLFRWSGYMFIWIALCFSNVVKILDRTMCAWVYLNTTLFVTIIMFKFWWWDLSLGLVLFALYILCWKVKILGSFFWVNNLDQVFYFYFIL